MSTSDLLAITALLALLAPLYLVSSSTIPFGINADEVAFSNVERVAQLQTDVHWLGLGRHWHMPHFLFYWRGKIGTWLGGITIPTMRLVSGATGLAAVITLYLLGRLRFRPIPAFAMAAIAGANHALVGLSRQALRNNEILFLSAASLALLWSGLQRNSRLLTFAAGVCAGLTFYIYDVARITIFIWLIFSLVLATGLARGIERTRALRSLPLVLAGFLLAAQPVLIDTLRQWPDSLKFSRATSLLTPEGRETQKGWVSATTEAEGVRQNIVDGLTAFNNRTYDRGNVYPNHGMGNGFLDPLTGILLWIGLLAIVGRVVRRAASGMELLMAVAFTVLWLAFALLINKAPNYSRMLITLGPVAFLALEGALTVGRGLGTLTRRWRPGWSPAVRRTTTVALVAGMIIWNQVYYWRNMSRALLVGNDIGNTGRYITARNTVSRYHFVLAADFSYPYFEWNDQLANWRLWLSFFAGADQTISIIAPQQVQMFPLNRPFTVFMGHRLWQESGSLWLQRFPDLRIHTLKTDGSILAIEAR